MAPVAPPNGPLELRGKVLRPSTWFCVDFSWSSGQTSYRVGPLEWLPPHIHRDASPHLKGGSIPAEIFGRAFLVKESIHGFHEEVCDAVRGSDGCLHAGRTGHATRAARAGRNHQNAGQSG